MLFRCNICEERAIEREEFLAGKQICDPCNTIRELNPKLFDYFVRIIDSKVEKALDSHWNSYHNDNDY